MDMSAHSWLTTEQVTHYYPFGGLWGDLSTNQGVQPYKFGGKELDRMYGYDLYDFGARFYDPAIARFTGMDPLAEKYYHLSPYAYCANNPVNYVDPDGKDTLFFNDQGMYTHRVKAQGNHIGVTPYKGREVTFNFVYQGDADRFLNENEKYNRQDYLDNILFVGKEDVNRMTESIPSVPFIRLFGWFSLLYAAEESRGGNLDYVSKPFIQEKPHTLFITNSEQQYIGQDAWNYGNYLWGASMRKLGIPYPTAVIGAHFHNFFKDSNHRWHLDSLDDQISICLGYFHFLHKHDY